MSWKTSSCIQVWTISFPPKTNACYFYEFLFFVSVGYVAGFVDPEVRDRSDLFDVYVNLPDSEITVSQNAKGERFSFTY